MRGLLGVALLVIAILVMARAPTPANVCTDEWRRESRTVVVHTTVCTSGDESYGVSGHTRALPAR